MEESGGCCSGCGGGDAVEEVGAEAEDGGEARGHFVGRDWAIVSRESEREWELVAFSIELEIGRAHV